MNQKEKGSGKDIKTSSASEPGAAPEIAIPSNSGSINRSFLSG